MRKLALLFVPFFASLGMLGCDDEAAQPDAAQAVDAAACTDPSGTICCGHCSDTGNSKGIGKFCQSTSDCASTPTTTLCSNIVPMTYFCTTICDPNGDWQTKCGENTVCAGMEIMGMKQHGCVPASCTVSPPAECPAFE